MSLMTIKEFSEMFNINIKTAKGRVRKSKVIPRGSRKENRVGGVSYLYAFCDLYNGVKCYQSQDVPEGIASIPQYAQLRGMNLKRVYAHAPKFAKPVDVKRSATRNLHLYRVSDLDSYFETVKHGGRKKREC